jgi:2'-5' RNA ligase
MPRLFTAIELDSQARAQVVLEQQRLARQLQDEALRWVQPEHMHLTLVFVGEIAADRAERLEGTMSQEMRLPSFQIELGGHGVFPSRGAPRILWLGVRRGAAAVMTLQRQISLRLKELDVPLEERPFHPHLTLARWRASGRPSRPRDIGSSSAAIAELHVAQVALVESRLSSRGPTYTIRAFARLAAAGAGLH